MSTEPKYPKTGVNAHFEQPIGAPDGFYLLGAGARLVRGDLNFMSSGEWVPLETFLEDDTLPVSWAWTYARKLPEGQSNDDDGTTPASGSYTPASDYWESQIAVELARARRKFPNWPTDPVHAAAIVSEEAGELVRAVNEACYEPHKTNPARPLDAVITEAIQLGAMVRRFLESAGHYVVAPGPQHDQSD